MKPVVKSLRRRFGCWLFVVFLLSVALHALLIACQLDMPGNWWWMTSGLLVISSGLLLVLWVLLRVLAGIWLRPRLREVSLALLSVLVFLWGYRGFTPPTEYCLRLWSCDGATIRPTWHISPLKRLYYSMTDSYADGRDGLVLWVNMIEAGHNYSPILGHGPCELSFSLYGGCGPHVRDSFTLELPQSREAAEVELKLAADTTALGVIVLPHEEDYDLISSRSESPVEAAQRHGR